MTLRIRPAALWLAISLVVPVLGPPARSAAQGAEQDARQPRWPRTCSELDLQRRLAAEPARTELAGGRISLVLPPGLPRLDDVDIGMGIAPRGARYAFGAGGTSIDFRFLSDSAEVDSADVDSDAFRERWESWAVRRAGTSAIEWINRGVVERNGVRWLGLDFVFTRSHQTPTHYRVYITRFGGGILAAGFLGPAGTPYDGALDSSLASLKVENCDLVTPIDMLVDSAALAQAVSAIPPPQLPAGIRPIFVLAFDSTGSVESVEPLFDTIPPSYASPVAAALKAAARRQLSRDPAGAYWVRVVAGPTPLVDLPEVERTQPVGDMRALERSLRGLAMQFEVRPQTSGVATVGLMVTMRVLSDGSIEPGSVRLTRSSGVDWVDAEVLERVVKAKFRPAAVDGVPIKTWVTLPIILGIRN
jgi:TonB family protein